MIGTNNDSNEVKLILPPLEIAPDEGFGENDLFEKKEFGDNLAKIIGSLNRGVVALDASWGQGKTTFIKMWRGHVKHHLAGDKKFSTIYYDAFASDYHQEPFLALSSQIYATIDGKQKRNEFKKNVTSFAKKVAANSVSILTEGVVNNDAIETLFGDNSDAPEKNSDAIDLFRKGLENVVKRAKSDNKSLVFIIDELDRCRPDFALELLEKIKHLFSVEGIVFLLVTNRSQLAKVIHSKYGVEQGDEYLQKFVNVWFNFPVQTPDRLRTNAESYVRYLCKKQADIFEQNEYVAELQKLVQLTKPSLREVEQIMFYTLLLHKLENFSDDRVYFQIAFFFAYLKVCRADTFAKLSAKTIETADITEEFKLFRGKPNYDFHTYKSLMNWLIYDLGDSGKRAEIAKKPGFNWLDSYYSKKWMVDNQSFSSMALRRLTDINIG